MSHVICESEGTVRGTVQVIRNETGTFDVVTAEEGGDFEIRHPAGDADSTIRALGHYLHGEAYQRRKAASKLDEMTRLMGLFLITNDDELVITDPQDCNLKICQGCQEKAGFDDENGVQHNESRHIEFRRKTKAILLQMIKE